MLYNNDKQYETSSQDYSETFWKMRKKIDRLEALVQVRNMYQNLLRGEKFLSIPSPIFKITCAKVFRGNHENVLEFNGEDVKIFCELIGEMEIISQQLQRQLRIIDRDAEIFLSLFKDQAVLELIRMRVRQMSDELCCRIQREIRLGSSTCPVYLENTLKLINDDTLNVYKISDANCVGNTVNRIDMIEKEIVKIAAFMLEVMKKGLKAKSDSSKDMVVGLAWYSRGLWIRLNGCSTQHGEDLFPENMLRPFIIQSQCERENANSQLMIQIAGLENTFKSAIKTRETRLRKIGFKDRATVVGELREMDQEVIILSRELAVRSLQLELEFIYNSLEEEAIDMTIRDRIVAVEKGPLHFESPNDIALLVAEFSLVAEKLAVLSLYLDRGEAFLIDDLVLERLAREIPDMRFRLGIQDRILNVETSSIGLQKVRMQITDSIYILKEGYLFFIRGIKLLVNDVNTATCLFIRAALGGVLRQREVCALRRTSRDILSFVPFTLILLIPLSPIGHVLVFGFIQKYFPGFFPSQFSQKRQELMIKYEILEGELERAQLDAEIEQDEIELSRVAQAVSRFTSSQGNIGDGKLLAKTSWSSPPKLLLTEEEGPAMRYIRSLERKVEKAATENFVAEHISLNRILLPKSLKKASSFTKVR